jgi:hypothetical protein
VLAKSLSHRKNQVLVRPSLRDLPLLSNEFVEAFHELFHDAIDWYEHTQISDEERFESDNPKYSLLSDLRTRVDNKQEFSPRDRELRKLLEAILPAYHKHLNELRQKPWSRKETVEQRLDEIDRVLRQGDLVLKLD